MTPAPVGGDRLSALNRSADALRFLVGRVSTINALHVMK